MSNELSLHVSVTWKKQTNMWRLKQRERLLSDRECSSWCCGCRLIRNFGVIVSINVFMFYSFPDTPCFSSNTTCYVLIFSVTLNRINTSEWNNNCVSFKGFLFLRYFICNFLLLEKGSVWTTCSPQHHNWIFTLKNKTSWNLVVDDCFRIWLWNKQKLKRNDWKRAVSLCLFTVHHTPGNVCCYCTQFFLNEIQ